MQECKKCGASWTFSKYLDICPFCGAELFEQKEMKTIEDALEYMVQKHGIEIFAEREPFLSLLADYAPGLSKERNLIKIAVNAGMYERLFGVRGSESGEQKKIFERCVCSLSDLYCLDKNWARQAMEWEAKFLKMTVGDSPSQTDIPKSPKQDENITLSGNVHREARENFRLSSDRILDSGENWTFYVDGTLVVHFNNRNEVAWANRLENKWKLPIRRLIFDEGITETGEGGFIGLRYLKEINFPTTLKEISIKPFVSCERLAIVDIPEGTETIRDGAFGGCSRLEEVYIPMTVKYIGKYAFSGCPNLLSFYVDKECDVGEGNPSIRKKY